MEAESFNGHCLRFWLLLCSFYLISPNSCICCSFQHCACGYPSNTDFQIHTACVHSPSPPQAVCTCLHSPSSHQFFPALVHWPFSSVYSIEFFVLPALSYLNFFFCGRFHLVNIYALVFLVLVILSSQCCTVLLAPHLRTIYTCHTLSGSPMKILYKALVIFTEVSE